MKRIKFDVDLTPKIRATHDFARDAHEGQLTPGTNKHLMFHLAKTAEIIMNHGATETMMCACLLKDTLQLTQVRLDQIKDLFGIKVSTLVKDLSKDIVWPSITDVAIPIIKIAESIDLLSRLDSNRLGLEYKSNILEKARILLYEVTPLAKALALIDSDLSIMNILEELEKAYTIALEVVDVEEEV